MLRNALLAVALSLPLFAVGCSVESSDNAEGSGSTDNAIEGTQDIGSQFKTTANLNLREGPSTSDDIIRTLALGSVVTILDGEPVNGFYNVQNGSDTGYVFGQYLASGATKLKTKAPIGIGDGDDDDDDDNSAATTGDDDDDDDDSSASGGGLQPTGQIQTCKASFYTEGQKTADGETFNTNALTAAHKTLPFNTMVKVTNTVNGKSVNVRINDRGPFVASRCIDLSRAAFTSIGSISAGVLSVKVETLK